MSVTKRSALGLVLVALLASGCKKKQAAEGEGAAGSAAAGSGAAGSAEGSAAGSAEPTEAPPQPPAAPRTPLPAGTVVDQPGTELAKPKIIAIGDVVEGEIREAEEGKDPPPDEHYYRLDAKLGAKLKIEWAIRSAAGHFGVNATVMDDGENIIVPEREVVTDQQGWVRTDWDTLLPPITTAKPLIVKISVDTMWPCCGRYRFRIVP